MNSERTLLFWILLLSVAAGFAGAWLIARSLARPIGELRQAMTVVGSGDLDHPITPRSGDEIGDLARSFQQMTGNLRQSRAELVHVNAELAAKVGQLETAQAQLVEQEKLASVGQMAAGVAHGLRNPLASLRASAQLALRHPDSPAARESLESMISEVDRLDKRITHLLTFSRPAPLHPMRENLATLVAGLVPALNRLLQDRAVTLRTDLPQDLPDTMLDPMKVEQTMHELIANALDAMPGGGTLAPGRARERRPQPACWWRSPTPARAFPRTCCRRCATRSSPRGPRAPGWASPSRSGSWSRTAARWRSAARPVAAPRCGIRFPSAATAAAGERMSGGTDSRRRRRAHPRSRHQGIPGGGGL